MRTAIYPGTFDPVTNGHMDIIRRAAKVADRLIIAIAAAQPKAPLFTLEERVEMMRKEVAALNSQGSDIQVKPFDGLLVKFAEEQGATLIIRGLRAVSDFEYEFQMAGMNHRMNPRIETLFLPASESTHFIASRFVKEIARLGGDISQLVSENVAKQLIKSFRR